MGPTPRNYILDKGSDRTNTLTAARVTRLRCGLFPNYFRHLLDLLLRMVERIKFDDKSCLFPTPNTLDSKKNLIKQGVAFSTGRNTASPPCSVGHPTAHTPGRNCALSAS